MGEEEHQETTLLLRPQETKKTTSLEFFKTIAPIMFLQASVGLCASLQATFYPIEAELKGATHPDALKRAFVSMCALDAAKTGQDVRVPPGTPLVYPKHLQNVRCFKTKAANKKS